MAKTLILASATFHNYCFFIVLNKPNNSLSARCSFSRIIGGASFSTKTEILLQRLTIFSFNACLDIVVSLKGLWIIWESNILTDYNINGAGNETRTRDIHVGNVVLYQLSYSRGGGGSMGTNQPNHNQCFYRALRLSTTAPKHSPPSDTNLAHVHP